MDLVSVIIPTYNRFEFLHNTIKSIIEQTYKNIEIIVVNDCSSQKEYYEYDWSQINNLTIIHLHEQNKSRKVKGYPCVGYVRNIGIEKASGKYIAFCDDDDTWFSTKLDKQITAIYNSNCKMSCTDAYYGDGVYDINKNYKIFNKEHFYGKLKQIYRKNKSKSLDNGFPDIWNLRFIQIHNCIITSSVVIEKNILTIVNGMGHKRRGQDYECWLKALKHTDCIFVAEPLVYYDSKHGNGQNH